MTRVTTIKALRAGIGIFVRRFPLLMGVWIIILGLNQLIDLAIPDRFYLAAAAAQVMIFGPLYVGQYFVTLRVLRDQSTGIGDLLEGFNRWGTIISLYLVFFAAALVAMGFLSLLGLVGYALASVFLVMLALTYAFVPILLVDRDHPRAPMKLKDALLAGALLARGRRRVLFGIALLLGLPVFVLLAADYVSLVVFEIQMPTWLFTVLALIGGSLFVGPVSAASYAVVYEVALRDEVGGSRTSLDDLDSVGKEVGPVDTE